MRSRFHMRLSSKSACWHPAAQAVPHYWPVLHAHTGLDCGSGRGPRTAFLWPHRSATLQSLASAHCIPAWAAWLASHAHAHSARPARAHQVLVVEQVGVLHLQVAALLAAVGAHVEVLRLVAQPGRSSAQSGSLGLGHALSAWVRSARLIRPCNAHRSAALRAAALLAAVGAEVLRLVAQPGPGTALPGQPCRA